MFAAQVVYNPYKYVSYFTLMNSESIKSLIDELKNLANADHGAACLSASDDFFAPKERMLASHDPEWKEDVYDDHGKWMDGWESRRKRQHGHDFCVVRLSAPGVIRVIEISTEYFTGNFPPLASLDGCRLDHDPNDETEWTEILSQESLQGNNRHFFKLDNEISWSHVRLNIYPDGGVARLRIYGENT